MEQGLASERPRPAAALPASRGGTGTGRPPGGVSPVQIEAETRGKPDAD